MSIVLETDADYLDDSLEIENEGVQVDGQFMEEFSKEITSLAKEYIDLFFQDKELHCGGPIPKSMKYSRNFISLMLNTDILEGVDKTYEILERNCWTSDGGEDAVSKEIRTVIDILNYCASLGIPKCFAGGLMIMYFEICEGLS